MDYSYYVLTDSRKIWAGLKTNRGNLTETEVQKILSIEKVIEFDLAIMFDVESAQEKDFSNWTEHYF